MLFSVETKKKQYFKEVLDHLQIDFAKLPFFRVNIYCATYENNVVA